MQVSRGAAQARVNGRGAEENALQESRALRQAIGRFRTRRQWLAHPEGPQLAARATALLKPVWRQARAAASGAAHTEAPEPGAEPRRDWVHVVHWNILHGGRYDAILDALQHEPALIDADLVSLNEVDLGLARSGNRNVAFDAASALGLHAVWAAMYLELEGGTAGEAQRESAPGQADDAESLFGLALLSRFPLGAARRVELQTPSDLLFDRERKVGQFIALLVEVQHPQESFHVVVTHLDVHGTPAVRRAQMQTILQALPPGPALLCGDFNTTTLARGNWLRSLRAFGALALTPRGRLDRRLQRPQDPVQRPREPLFGELERAGFEFERFNNSHPSLDLRLAEVHEVQTLPVLGRRLGGALLRHVERRSHHRLDWIAARGFARASARPPFTLQHLMRGPDSVSDHAPIGCGVRPAPADPDSA
ncbi:MAG: endonuclease/exonuclease/phosphatase family protein [Candidatus Latescibacterota bacterium]|nr:MAG: endonuclease/exonuclease/phosphatase family protein [Candidatus Latescibacterota bacterium]